MHYRDVLKKLLPLLQLKSLVHIPNDCIALNICLAGNPELLPAK